MSPGFNEKEEKSGGQLGNPELKCRTTLELTRISSLLLADMLLDTVIDGGTRAVEREARVEKQRG